MDEEVFPGTVKPKSGITPELATHLRYPEDLFKVQRMLLAKYHVNDPVTFFSTSDFWDVPLDPNPTASSYLSFRRTTSSRKTLPKATIRRLFS